MREIEAERQTQQLIKGIACFPLVPRWLQVSGRELHQERNSRISSLANTDVVQLDSE
jgi:hypothetical protein